MRTFGAILVFPLAFGLASCAPPEKVVVDTFLGAARDGQKALLEAVSLVEFPGKGVTAWEVLEVGEESIETYRLAELRQAVADAKKAEEAKIMEGDDFLRSNETIAIRYQEKMREDPEYRYPGGEMAEFQEAWDKEVEGREEFAKKVTEAQEVIKLERKAIQMSTKIALKTTLEGDVSVKKVKVQVEGSGGSKTYDLTLRRYNLTDSETGITPTTSWIVVGVA